MPTNNNKEGKKIFVNGEEKSPANKVKLPRDIDWEKIIRDTEDVDLDDLEE